MKKYFTELIVNYNNRNITIRQLINEQNFKTHLSDINIEDDEDINKNILVKGKHLNLINNKEHICIDFYVNSMRIKMFQVFDLKKNIGIEKEYYDNGQLRILKSNHKTIKFYQTGKIESITDNEKLMQLDKNNPYSIKYDLNGNVIEEEYQYMSDENEKMLKRILYYTNGKIYSEFYLSIDFFHNIHNLNGPANIIYDINGEVLFCEFSYKGNVIKPTKNKSKFEKQIKTIDSKDNYNIMKLELLAMKYNNIINENEYNLYLQKIDTYYITNILNNGG